MVMLIAIFFVIGMSIAAQLRGQRALSKVRQVASSADQAAVISGLVESNKSLRDEVDQLRSSLSALDEQGGTLPVLVEELNRVKILNGTAEASGPGVVLRIDGPTSVADLQDLVNELRNAGAEAIALNDVRLGLSSVVVSTSVGMQLDGFSIQRPFVLQAIGDSQAMLSAMGRPGGLVSLLRASHPEGVFDLVEASHLTLPVTAREFTVEYASIVR
jgi:uncharacterized protein YlxW (UPF0749 family)